MQTTHAESRTTESDIWVRLIEPGNGDIPKAAAKGILSLNFSDKDKARMQDLAERNKEGTLSAAEREELENYVLVGDVLSLLHLKAKKSLNR
jgi:hypothetical protein